jgi:hypothetical protein
MINHAQPTPTSAAASMHGAASPSLELLEARRLRDAIAALLRRERDAMADFLVALSDFDQRRGWEVLGYPNFFAFLTSELGLTPAPTYWRLEAARLLQRFPELIEPLRQGRLCLTTLGELSRVLTEENRAEVLPRFLGISSREAKEIVAELQPRPSPPMRTVVRPLVPSRGSEAELSLLAMPLSAVIASAGQAAQAAQAGLPQPAVALSTAQDTDPESLWAPKLQGAYPAPDDPRRLEPRRDEVDPLTAELSRLSTTVSRRFLAKLKSAREGLGHAIPRATTEQVLEAALDMLLEKQARARGQVKRPREVLTTAAPTSTLTPSATAPATPTEAPTSAPTEIPPSTPSDAPSATSTPTPTEPPPHRRDGPRAAIPAAVKRAVWARDGSRCCWPIDGGGTCGSKHQLEFDHIVPWAEWGGETQENLRVVCRAHNRLAARHRFGARCVGRYQGSATGGAG